VSATASPPNEHDSRAPQLDIPAFEARHNLDFAVYFAAECAALMKLAADGIVVMTPDRIAATARGRPLLRIVAMCFDRYLARRAAWRPVTPRPCDALCGACL